MPNGQGQPVESTVRAQSIAELQQQAAAGRIADAALNHIAQQGALGAAADDAWSLEFGLSWLTADLETIAERGAPRGGHR